MRSEEVLASPGGPASHPVRRALLVALIVAAAAWALVARLNDPAEQTPGATPTSTLPSEESGTDGISVTGDAVGGDRPAPVSPYRATPLDGHWMSPRLTSATAAAIPGTRPGQRLVLQVRGTALVVWVGGQAPPTRSMLGYEAIALSGHQVQVSPVGASHEKAVYRWHLQGDRLRFALVDRTTGASASERLVTVPFTRFPFG